MVDQGTTQGRHRVLGHYGTKHRMLQSLQVWEKNEAPVRGEESYQEDIDLKIKQDMRSYRRNRPDVTLL